MKKKSRFLQTPIEPFAVEAGLTADEILSRMERISFQGRSLATAHRIWRRMLEDDVTIFMGMAGALSAGGLRMIVAHLITHRYIDCLVSTGANLYHDLHETRGQHHYAGSPHADDAMLAKDRIDRVYDTFASEEEFIGNDNWIADFAASLERRPYTSREFLHRLGGHLWETTRRDGILTSAYRANVPIFCPAIADSSIGMGLSQARQKVPGTGYIDIIGDVVESANIVIRRPRTASVVLGGGTPKNFINQATVQAEFFSDVPQFGGASGSTLEEAQSWGKLATDSARVSVQADATIALPLLASALAHIDPDVLAHRRRPMFTLASRVMTIDDQPLSCDRFEAQNEHAV